MTISNKTKIFVSGLLVISMVIPSVFFSTPKKAEAVLGIGDISFDPTNYIPNWMQQVWGGLTTTATELSAYFDSHKFANFLLEQVLKRTAKALLAKMTQSIINWINSDFHGSPLFVQNPESFFRDIAKSEIRYLVDFIGYDTFRFPFGPQTALNVINSYKRQLDENARYTLSKVVNDPDLLRQYRNDFNYGGWNGFLVNTQYPQNNYLGFNQIIEQNLASRLEGTLQAPAQAVQSALQQGMGFLSPQTCPSNPDYNNGINEFVRPTFKYDEPYPQPEDFENDASFQQAVRNYDDNKDLAHDQWVKSNLCPGGLVATTPGSVAANQVFNALNVPFLETALDGALGNSLSAIFDALINHFVDKGLSALSDTISPQPSFDSNWSYNGNSLNSGTTTSIGSTPLNIPQNVSVIAGEETSTRISGGTQPYRITIQPNQSIATATIDVSGTTGPKLTIKGITPGKQTYVEIRDNSPSGNSVVVQITVTAVGELTSTPRNILTNTSNPITAIISGGTPPYEKIAGPNETVAAVEFQDTTLVVVGLSVGETSVKIRDSVGNVLDIPINISDNGSLIFPSTITTNVDQTASTVISGGTPPYDVLSVENSSVANINIPLNTNTILTTGLSVGNTILVVQDHSFPKNTATINISVVNAQILRVNPQNIFTGVGDTTVANILGGYGEYSIQELPDPIVARADIQGDLLIITGNAPGETKVVIKDSLNHVVEVPIFIDALTISPKIVSTTVGGIVDVTISGGNSPYTIETDPTAGVATATPITNNTQYGTATTRVTARGIGTTSMEVKDSSNPAKYAWITIKVNQ